MTRATLMGVALERPSQASDGTEAVPTAETLTIGIEPPVTALASQLPAIANILILCATGIDFRTGPNFTIPARSLHTNVPDGGDTADASDGNTLPNSTTHTIAANATTRRQPHMAPPLVRSIRRIGIVAHGGTTHN